VHGLSLKECVELFLADPDTKGIVVIGELGGRAEEDVAAFVAIMRPAKPIVALVAGRHAPPERRMGHAGAFATGGSGMVGPKIEAMRAAGIMIAPNAAAVGATMMAALPDYP
jgi:succinyl-CoA synthetase alpha subunit